MWPNSQEFSDMFTFTEKTFHFLSFQKYRPHELGFGFLLCVFLDIYFSLKKLLLININVETICSNFSFKYLF